jgi:hypothetical protein
MNPAALESTVIVSAAPMNLAALESAAFEKSDALESAANMSATLACSSDYQKPLPCCFAPWQPVGPTNLDDLAAVASYLENSFAISPSCWLAGSF